MVVAIPPGNRSGEHVGGDDQRGNYIPCDVGLSVDRNRKRNTEVISRPSARRDGNDVLLRLRRSTRTFKRVISRRTTIPLAIPRTWFAKGCVMPATDLARTETE
jgi:hypothetical protein